MQTIKILCIYTVAMFHVGAKAALLLRFRKKSRSACLFGCKRPHDGSLSLPTFCELREFNALLRKSENIFFIVLRQIGKLHFSLVNEAEI